MLNVVERRITSGRTVEVAEYRKATAMVVEAAIRDHATKRGLAINDAAFDALVARGDTREMIALARRKGWFGSPAGATPTAPTAPTPPTAAPAAPTAAPATAQPATTAATRTDDGWRPGDEDSLRLFTSEALRSMMMDVLDHPGVELGWHGMIGARYTPKMGKVSSVQLVAIGDIASVKIPQDGIVDDPFCDCVIHLHPSGNLTPSDKDRRWGEYNARLFGTRGVSEWIIDPGLRRVRRVSHCAQRDNPYDPQPGEDDIARKQREAAEEAAKWRYYHQH